MIDIYFGNPGCGKTTFAVYLMKKSKRTCFANFDHKVPKHKVCSLDKLGEWTFPQNSHIMIDEAGIEYNNRRFKALPQSTIKWFKLHRHFRCDCSVFSQSWEDMDVTIRRLADRLWYMRKIGPFTIVRRVYKRVEIDEKTHQIIDGYKMSHLAWLLIYPLQNGFLFTRKFYILFRPLYYKYFDSYEVPSGVPVNNFN